MKLYIFSFFSGVASFFSPCVLPLVPGYLSLISGFSAKEIIEGNENSFDKIKLLYFSLFFVLGFSVVFSLLGAFSSYAGGFISQNKTFIQRVMGILMILIGMHISQIFEIKFFNFEKRKIYKTNNISYIASFVTGMSFAFGWSPCIGPFLANLLFIASTQQVYKGLSLLFIYSLGLGMPFILVSILAGSFFRFISKHRRFFFYLEKFAGILIVLIGILIFFDKFSLE